MDHILQRAVDMRRAADIFESQARHRNRIWMKSMVDRDIGRDVHDLVKDVDRFENTGRTRDKTWADPKKAKEVRQMRNTMGYVPNL